MSRTIQSLLASGLASSTDLPILLYNNPGQTGINLSVDPVVKLNKIDNIVGIKDNSGDMTQGAEYIRKTDDNFSVLAGRDTLIYRGIPVCKDGDESCFLFLPFVLYYNGNMKLYKAAHTVYKIQYHIV